MDIEHSAKGTTWGKHKYLRIENGRYIYSETDKKGKSSSRDATITEIHDRLKNFKLTKGKSGSSKASSKKSGSEKEKSSGSKKESESKKTSTEKEGSDTKINTSRDEQAKDRQSVDEKYTQLLEKLRARKNESLLPQIREKQLELEKKKKSKR